MGTARIGRGDRSQTELTGDPARPSMLQRGAPTPARGGTRSARSRPPAADVRRYTRRKPPHSTAPRPPGGVGVRGLQAALSRAGEPGNSANRSPAGARHPPILSDSQRDARPEKNIRPSARDPSREGSPAAPLTLTSSAVLLLFYASAATGLVAASGRLRGPSPASRIRSAGPADRTGIASRSSATPLPRARGN